MSSSIIFINHQWITYAIIAIVVLWFVYIWKEWKTRKTKSFYISSSVALFAILSLGVLALRPAVQNIKPSKNTIVLTDNYDQSIIDDIKERHKNIQTITYKTGYSIIKDESVFDTVFVVGNGVATYDLWQLENQNTVYKPSVYPKGIIKYKYTENTILGDEFVFKGSYHLPQKGNTLLLEGVGGQSLDSVTLVAGKDQVFQLTSKSNVKGKYLYSLVEKDSLGIIITKNPIPVFVKEPVKLKILILNSSPTFETKYLKNYLVEKGHQLAIKTKITKGKYKYEYFNSEEQLFTKLTEDNLTNFDLLIIDSEYLKSLNNAISTILNRSVREKGLGVFIQPDVSIYNTLRNFGNFNFQKERSTKISMQNWPKIKLSKKEFSFKEDLLLQPLHQSIHKEIISGYKQFGKGRIGTSILENTYQQQLKGNPDVYKKIWSDIIGVISKSNNATTQWISDSRIAYIDEPFNFTIRTSIINPIIKYNEGVVSMKRNIDMQYVWKGTTFPYKLGWNTLYLTQDNTQVFDYYVTDTTHWKSLQIYKTMKYNKKILSTRNVLSKEKYYIMPIEPLLFIIVFLLCVGYLWIEPKLK